MPREFNDADRMKKSARIDRKTNHGTGGAPAGLEEAIKAALDKGYLPCPVGFGLASKLKIPLTVVGDTADSLGIRISNCQLGCFKVDKNLHHDLNEKIINQTALEALEAFQARTGSKLTCTAVFQIAKRIGVRPIEVADAANWKHAKIHECQLGCW